MEILQTLILVLLVIVVAVLVFFTWVLYRVRVSIIAFIRLTGRAHKSIAEDDHHIRWTAEYAKVTRKVKPYYKTQLSTGQTTFDPESCQKDGDIKSPRHKVWVYVK